MGSRSRRKGKVGERQAAAELGALLGVDAKRGAQHRGGPDSPDVVLPGVNLHVECKRTEKLSLWPAVEQATRDAAGRPWLVWHRPNGRPSVVIVQTSMLVDVAREVVLAAGMGEHAETEDPVQNGWVGKDGRP